MYSLCVTLVALLSFQVVAYWQNRPRPPLSPLYPGIPQNHYGHVWNVLNTQFYGRARNNQLKNTREAVNPRPTSEAFTFDVYPLPNGGTRYTVYNSPEKPRDLEHNLTQPEDGDIVQIWSPMSVEGGGYLRVTNQIAPNGGYYVDSKGYIEDSNTKFRWWTTFPRPSLMDAVVLRMSKTQFLGNETEDGWYIITYSYWGPSYPTITANMGTWLPTVDQIWNPTFFGNHLRLEKATSSGYPSIFLNAKRYGQIEGYRETGRPEVAKLWPNPGTLFFIYDQGIQND
ncbi:uncharacterized protein LOC106167642 [Lingula anatina]|uniref:Uncharacterized protein LOC106167642 n=1 Tax=Lingula anatina TaxID=7574 RepID=A0A1S3IV35_LINAN|nr:uncharacterized protein LOC106167642 [Lingula anatina]|eukprot:XP_013401933.1 uncharacterized protein LOC106167642 [Lingula anatina]